MDYLSFIISALIWVCASEAFSPQRLPIAKLFDKRDLAEEHISLNICYFCDKRCQNWIAQKKTYADVGDYYKQLTSNVETIMKNLVSDFKLTSHAVWTPDAVVDYSLAVTQRDKDALTQANKWVWDSSKVFKDKAIPMGCNIAFASIAPSDKIFQLSNSVVAIANMFQVCGNYSHGMLKLIGSMQQEAKLMAHEVGHLLGIYHDGALDASYNNYAKYMTDNYPTEWETLKQECTTAKTQSAWNVMHPIPTGSNSQWSECSKAYFNMYLMLVNDPQMGSFYFFNDCAHSTQKRSHEMAFSEQTLDDMVNSLKPRTVNSFLSTEEMTHLFDEKDNQVVYVDARECNEAV